MRFQSVTGEVLSSAALADEYKAARAIGVIRVGETHLFFRVRTRTYAVPYGEIRRCYRRVMQVQMRICCGRGSLNVENLVIEGESGEMAQIQLPGTRAARELMELLKQKIPDAEFVPPAREDKT